METESGMEKLYSVEAHALPNATCIFYTFLAVMFICCRKNFIFVKLITFTHIALQGQALFIIYLITAGVGPPCGPMFL
jgi:hypothetical protein